MDIASQAGPVGPPLSAHFAHRQPSAIRIASIRYEQRTVPAQAINVAIGNVSLPMHPAMRARLARIHAAGSPFAEGVVRYTSTAGLPETRSAFLRVIESSDVSVEGLHAQVTDGGSQAMELMVLGCCGPAGSSERPLMLIDATYTNYKSFAARLGRRTVSIQRTLQHDGHFTLPSLDRIDAIMREARPGALLVIPYDNPTGQLYEREVLVQLARLCVRHDLWLVSDEAYRELHYRGDRAVSVWSLTEAEVPGITGRRISIETTSKVWNACGLRIGALVTDNPRMHVAAVAENTASLCSNHLGQWIFGALAGVPRKELHSWYEQQRSYYRAMMQSFTVEMLERMPGLVVSRPDASLYSVVDVRNIAPPGFDSLEFVLWCAEHGALELGGESWTLLTAPMGEFYDVPPDSANPGRTQLRVAYVETPERMARVPMLLAGLLQRYFQRG